MFLIFSIVFLGVAAASLNGTLNGNSYDYTMGVSTLYLVHHDAMTTILKFLLTYILISQELGALSQRSYLL
jgi:hypothetical protein